MQQRTCAAAVGWHTPHHTMPRRRALAHLNRQPPTCRWFYREVGLKAGEEKYVLHTPDTQPYAHLYGDRKGYKFPAKVGGGSQGRFSGF